MIHTLTVRTEQPHRVGRPNRPDPGLVRQSGVEEGVCHLFQAHTTAGLTINENADPSVQPTSSWF